MVANVQKSKATNHYDVIVIGSGMGGLTTASLLAQVARKRVLLVESHFKLGGFTHSFRRGHYEWDAGVHYVGEMQEGSLTRRMMDLVTGGGVKWRSIGSPVERYVFPEGEFEVPDDPAAFEAALIARFPDDKPGIRTYFRDLRRIQGWIARWFVSKQYSPRWADWLIWPGRELASANTGDYLARTIRDPFLRAILAAQWPDYGTPPAASALGLHGTVAADFLHGGYYPVGGAQEISDHVASIVKSQEGDCLVSSPVSAIIIHNGIAQGVRITKKHSIEEYFAPVIVSNAGAATTFGRLVPQAYGVEERRRLDRIQPGTSANILFLGLREDPRMHGFDACNYWIYSRSDHDVNAKFQQGQPDEIDGAYLSFGSLRNPGQTPHTAQIITFTSYDRWNQHAGTAWQRRGEEYELKKDQRSEEMLSFVAARYPALRDLVCYQELSTPLTIESFLAHPRGAIYGQACDQHRLFRDRWPIATSVRQLFLTGSDVGTPGVNGAMMGGVMTAARILGWIGLPRLFWSAYTRRHRAH